MFKTSTVSRGVDCGADRWVTLPAAVSVMEAARWAWLCDPELGLTEQLHRGHGFIVTEQRFAFARRFGIGVPYICTAQLTHVGRVEARAYQQLVSVSGATLAHSLVRGAWINAEGRLTRIPNTLRSAVEPMEPTKRDQTLSGELFNEAQLSASEEGAQVLESSLLTPPSPSRSGSLEWTQELKSTSLKANISEITHTTTYTTTHTTAVHVRASDCDMFRHVNASVYIRYFADALASKGYPSSVDRAWVRYEGQARAQDVLELRWSDLGEGVWRFKLKRDAELLVTALVEVSSE